MSRRVKQVVIALVVVGLIGAALYIVNEPDSREALADYERLMRDAGTR
ncbi:MAG: hypothetical protein JNM17_19820 [Archangium sp.]|nr:hypothetical protein [Archangium sp.]